MYRYNKLAHLSSMAKKQKLWQRLFSALHGTRPPISSQVTATHPCMREKLAAGRTLVLDVDAGLLLPSSSFPFPYFMLVALEAGGYLRGLVLLLLYPIILCMGGDSDVAVRLMAMAAFCGLRPSQFLAGCAVLPKWLMQDVAAEGFEMMRMSGATGGRRVCVSRKLPRVIVEGFLREYLGAEAVIGKEMKMLWGFYTGLMEEGDDGMLHEQQKIMLEGDNAVGFSGSLEFLQHPLSRCCKVVLRDMNFSWYKNN